MSREWEATKPRRIDTQARVVVPPEVMEALSVERGDFITFERKGSEVRVRKVAWKPV